MILYKPVHYIAVVVYLVSIFGKCYSYSPENVHFITKLDQKASEDWESDVIKPEELRVDIDKYEITTPNAIVENDQVYSEKSLSNNDGKEIKLKNDTENEIIGNKRRHVRQVNTGYTGIYPTLTPQYQPNPMYPTPYQPAAGNPYGSVPNTYPSNQNTYNNPAYSQTYLNPNGTIVNPARPPNQQWQNPFLKNTTTTYPGYYNQGSAYNNSQFNTNNQYPPYNQHNSRQPNTTYPTFQGNNYPPYGNNANRPTPTPVNQWTAGSTNNSRYTTPKYPNFNNPYRFNNYSTSLPTNKYPQYNPSSPPYQSYPQYNNTNSQNNYNRSNQWQNPQTQYNPGTTYPGYIPNDGRTSNVTRQNYPGYNPSSNPSSPYAQQPYSPNPSLNPYSQNYPGGSTRNYNNHPYK